jgi:hypothetical protein
MLSSKQASWGFGLALEQLGGAHPCGRDADARCVGRVIDFLGTLPIGKFTKTDCPRPNRMRRVPGLPLGKRLWSKRIAYKYEGFARAYRADARRANPKKEAARFKIARRGEKVESVSSNRLSRHAAHGEICKCLR